MEIGRVLIGLGIALVVAGVVVSYLGRLPGDVVWRRGNFTFYFPIVTSILLSVVLTLVMWLVNRR